MKLKIEIVFHFQKSKSSAKTNDLLLQLFVKPHLVKVLLIITFDTYKVGLVHTLLFQFLKICFSNENFYMEVEQLKSIFKYNNNLANIIDQCIKTFWTYCTSRNRLYHQYLKRKCQLLFHFYENFL